MAQIRVKALHRGRGIPCAGTQVYALKWRNCCARYPASVRFELPLIALMQTPHGSEASGNRGPMLARGLRPTTVRNSPLSVYNCNALRNPSSSVVSIRTNNYAMKEIFKGYGRQS
jgi:hypothetical protein